MSSIAAISIIIAVDHPAPRLQPLLESIWAQGSPPPDVVVVNRDSDDETRRVIEANRTRLAHVSSTTGPIYAALNEAIALASGEWVLLLGGRNRLVGDAVLSEVLNWMKKTEAGVVAGESASDDGRIEKLHAHVNAVAGDFTPSSATFYRRSLFAENGGFDSSLEVMGRYDFHVRLWKGRVRFKPIPLRIAACESPRERFDWRACREEIRVRHRYFSAARCVGWDTLTMLRWLRAGVFGQRHRG